MNGKFHSSFFRDQKMTAQHNAALQIVYKLCVCVWKINIFLFFGDSYNIVMNV